MVGDFAFTQEQRGPNEVVSSRLVTTGEVVWERAIEGRFEDTSSGPGPRSTPAYAAGRLYALTTMGVLASLDATDGTLLWEQDLQAKLGAEVPHWGFASSPLVVEDLVVIFTGAGDGRSIAAFDRVSGDLRWINGKGRYGYSSPQQFHIHQQPQILIASNLGLDSLDPRHGTLLWQHSWDIGLSPRIVQPCLLPDDSLLLATAYGKGTRRLQVEFQDGRWSVRTLWTNRKFKPYFNDFIYHRGFVYGFDGNILTCLDAETGRRRWRKRGFGNGQLLLFEPQAALLVLSEEGAVSLVEASDDSFQLIGEFQALRGKTWNHPVVGDSHLLVRNGTQAACYELPQAEFSRQ